MAQSAVQSHFHRKATVFEVELIEKIPTRRVGNNVLFDLKLLPSMSAFKRVAGKRGVYIFSFRTGARGGISYTPVYVGRTVDQTFGKRLTRGHEAETLAAHHGTPVLLLLFPQKGRGRAPAIRELERDLIQDAYWKNPNVTNEKNTPLFSYKISKVFPGGAGNSKARSALRSCLDWA
ncbi:MAG: hypothetical protein K2Y40_25380 [Reyranella sp.]|jgi:hypothetical protein|nr:hypothetical protein [Reyranella sp.]